MSSVTHVVIETVGEVAMQFEVGALYENRKWGVYTACCGCVCSLSPAPTLIASNCWIQFVTIQLNALAGTGWELDTLFFNLRSAMWTKSHRKATIPLKSAWNRLRHPRTPRRASAEPCTIDKLPDEVLSLVFALGALSYVEPVGDGVPSSLAGARIVNCSNTLDPDALDPLRWASTASLVCKRWRAVALWTPELWCKVAVTDHANPEVLAELLRRSSPRLVHFRLNMTGRETEPAWVNACFDIIRTHMYRCVSLSVQLPNCMATPALRDLFADCASAPKLEYLDLIKRPWNDPDWSLERQNAPLSWPFTPFFSESDPPRLLSAALSCQHLSFRQLSSMLRSIGQHLHSLNIITGDMRVTPQASVVELPLLCSLTLCAHGSLDLLQLLRLISVPRLQSLQYYSLRGPWVDIPDHVAENLSGVTHLTFSSFLHEAGTRTFYRQFPRLRVLQLMPAASSREIAALTSPPSTSAVTNPCPQLKTVILGRLSRYTVINTDFTWEDVHELVARRSAAGMPLSQLFFQEPPGKRDAFARQAVEHLRQFVADVRVFPSERDMFRDIPHMEIKDCSCSYENELDNAAIGEY